MDAEQNKESAKIKDNNACISIKWRYISCFGGDYPGNFALDSTKALATNVTGITVPLSGHWIPEDRPTVCH